MGDSAKVLEKKSLFFSRFKGSPGGGPLGRKKRSFFAGRSKTLGYRSAFGRAENLVFCFCLQKNLVFSSPGAR